MHYGYDYRIDTRVISGGKGSGSPLLSGLVSYWKLEEATGSRVDVNGVNNLTPTGTPGNAVGKIGNAVSLNGSTQYLTVADNGTLENATNYTICAWYKTSGGAQQAILNKGDSSVHDYVIAMNSAGTGRLNYIVSSSSANVADTVNTSDGAWHLVVAQMRTANTIQLWIDNVSKGTAAMTPALNNISFKLGILDTTFWFWNGQIDEVGFWNRALSTSEITQLWNSGAGLTHPFL